MKKSSACPKCDSGQMIQGFIPDISHPAAFVPGWQEGEPKKNFWTRVKVFPEAAIPIGTFRCNRCGFLEFYANSDFAAK
jgi:hypothetical protein